MNHFSYKHKFSKKQKYNFNMIWTFFLHKVSSSNLIIHYKCSLNKLPGIYTEKTGIMFSQNIKLAGSSQYLKSLPIYAI